jgi:flagellar basal-body rod protein FlgF
MIAILINASWILLGFEPIRANFWQTLPTSMALAVHYPLNQEVSMDSGFYAVSTALITQTQALDTIANNLANASTNGFRAEQNSFSSVLASTTGVPVTALNRAMNSYGVLSGTTLDLSQGAMQKTGNDLDVAIQGGGFFVVQTANGPKYTRNGSFQVSANSQLITATGETVLGDNGQPITILPGPVSIGPDGTISSNGAITGKLKVVEFPAGTPLQSAGGTDYTAPAGSGSAATNSIVQQGALESSNVNPITGTVDLISAQRTAEMMQHALSMFNLDMDKTAAQDLPKVG